MEKKLEAVKEIPYEIGEVKQLMHDRWLGVRQIEFVNKKNNHRGIWQVAYRTTRPQGATVDGVDIVATVCKGGRDYFLFVKQYRLPIMAWSLEFPAGLLDPNETPTQAALRELKEETGYTASEVIHTTKGIQNLDPGLTDDSINFVTVRIDGDSSESSNLTQKLDESEEIEVVLIPCDEALEHLARLTEEGIHVEAMVYSFVIGYSMNKTK